MNVCDPNIFHQGCHCFFAVNRPFPVGEEEEEVAKRLFRSLCLHASQKRLASVIAKKNVFRFFLPLCDEAWVFAEKPKKFLRSSNMFYSDNFNINYITIYIFLNTAAKYVVNCGSLHIYKNRQ